MKTALITGCSSGIGRETAERLDDNGWKVYASSRDPDDVTHLADRGMPTPALDVTDDEQVEGVVEQILDEEGRIDALVNNAGYGQMGAIEDVSVDEVHAQFDVNVYGPHRLTRAVLPHMREQGSGNIVNVSSIAGQLSFPGMGVYCGSKHALEAMSDAARAEVRGFGVGVALVEPGPVKTNFVNRVRDEMDVPDGTPYEPVYDRYNEREGGTEDRFAVGPEKVAKTIVEAAEASNPKARYTVTVPFRLARLGRHVPAKLRDRMYKRL